MQAAAGSPSRVTDRPVPQQSRLHLAASPLGEQPLAWAQQDASGPHSERWLLSSHLIPGPQATEYSLAASDTETRRNTISGSCSYVRLEQELLLPSPNSSARPCAQQQLSSCSSWLVSVIPQTTQACLWLRTSRRAPRALQWREGAFLCCQLPFLHPASSSSGPGTPL